jgi:hypothetical protein
VDEGGYLRRVVDAIERMRNGWLDFGGTAQGLRVQRPKRFLNALTSEMVKLTDDQGWRDWFLPTGCNQLLLYLFFDTDPPLMWHGGELRLRKVEGDLELKRVYLPEGWTDLELHPRDRARSELRSMLREVQRKRKLKPFPSEL